MQAPARLEIGSRAPEFEGMCYMPDGSFKKISLDSC